MVMKTTSLGGATSPACAEAGNGVKPADTKVSRTLARPNIFAEIESQETATCTARALLLVVRTLSSPRFSSLRLSSRTRAPRPHSTLCRFPSPCSNRFRRLRPERVELRADFSRSACLATLNPAARSSLRSRVVARPVRSAPANSCAGMSPDTALDHACGWRRYFLRTSGEPQRCQPRIPAPPPFHWTRERARRPTMLGDRGVHRAIFSSMT